MFQRIAWAGVLALFFTGCLTIEENYTFKKNGSGTLEYVVDMSELGELLKAFEEMGDNGEGAGAQEQIGTLSMEDEVEALKRVPGISAVKLNNKKQWVQRVQLRFKDVTALNAALNVLMPDSTGKPHEFFRWEGSTLVRTNNRHAYELGAGMAQAEDPSEEGEDMDMSALLGSMKYKFSFKFAQDISETTTAARMNKEAAAKREVRFDTDWSVIAQDREALDLRIQLAR